MDNPSQPTEKLRSFAGDNEAHLHPYPTPNPFSPQTVAVGKPQSQPYQSTTSSSSSVQGSVPPAAVSKVPIPRLATGDVSYRRRRSARACEPCRQRKIKCDGIRPACSQCIHHNHQCTFEDVKRVRDQKRLGSLAKRVEAYEALLRELEGEVDLPTARKIRKAMKNSGNSRKPDDDGSDSSTSMGSLEAIDQVDEDLNRSERTRAAGFFGKNSEVQWMRKLETGVSMKSPSRDGGSGGALNSLHSDSHQDASFIQKRQLLEKDISTSTMDYHLDNLDIPLIEPCDPFAVPPRELADRYLHAFLTYVHPTFSAIRKNTFTLQYQQFFNNALSPPQKWLAILNMIFAIGCRFSRLIDDPQSSEEDLLYLTRARLLGLHSKILFEHTDLQQIQLEMLVAIYLLCLGQVNRAHAFSNMALRSALSLGINLRLTDNRTEDGAKEARGRLWWSIYSMEHLLTSMTGRASCVSEGLCSVPLPLPCDEEAFDHPEAKRLFQDPALRESELRPTLFELHTQSPTQSPSQSCISTWPPSPSLFSTFLVDLTLVTHAIMNKVYSIEGLRKGASQIEYRIQKFDLKIDRWRTKLPSFYQFTLPNAGPWHLNHPQLEDLSAPFVRERVCLAMNYYSARIILYRPCLNIHPQSDSDASPRNRLRADMATNCLQAACAMIAILPESPDVSWLARAAPWWSVLHYLMQATTALLLGLSFSSYPGAPNPSKDWKTGSAERISNPLTPISNMYPPLLETDLRTAVESARKALWWLHETAEVDVAAKKAFELCRRIVGRIAPGLGIELDDWPDGGSYVEAVKGRREGGNGSVNGSVNNGSVNGHDIVSGMEAFEELIDFEGGVF